MTNTILRGPAPTARSQAPGAALFAAGFRPFYLLAAGFAAVGAPLWVAIHAGADIEPYFGGATWHGHEMLYGFVAALLVGFLYTAVPNWTGRPTPRGAPLAALAALWLAGRIAILAGALVPGWLTFALDVAFLPLAALGILVPLVAAGNWRNIGFPLALLVLAGGNLVLHLQASGTMTAELPVLRIGLDVVTVILVVMTGRLVPFFTGRALPQSGARKAPRLDRAALAAVMAALAAFHVAPTLVQAPLDLAAAVVLFARMVPWASRATLREPMLWILHAGHGFLVLFFLLRGLEALGYLPLPALAEHALAVGALGTLALGMMARSALGHSGRAIRAGAGLRIAFAATVLAGLARAVLPVVAPSLYMPALHLSALLWSLAFGLFLLLFLPVLTRPRPDGRTG